MPAKTEKQKRFFGAVMGAKYGQKNVTGTAKKAAKQMTKKEIKKYLKTEGFERLYNDVLIEQDYIGDKDVERLASMDPRETMYDEEPEGYGKNSPLYKAMVDASKAKEEGEIEYDNWGGDPDDLFYMKDMTEKDLFKIKRAIERGFKVEGLLLKDGAALGIL